MKKILKVLFIVSILASCNRQSISSFSNQESINSITNSTSNSINNSSSESVINSTSQNNTITDIPSSLYDSSIQSNSSNSTSNISVPDTILTIAQINQEITKLAINTKGINVTLRATYFSNYSETSAPYDRLMYFADATGFLYVRTSQNNAEKLLLCNKSYEIQGQISNYYNHYEVVMTTYKEINTLSVTALTNSERKDSIIDIHQDIKQIPLDHKGTSYTKMVSVEAQYIAKIDNALLLFYDGSNVIQLHGVDNAAFKYSSGQIGNNFILNDHYLLTGLIGEYLYKPGMQYVTATRLDKPNSVTFNNFKNIKASDIYKLSTDGEKSNFYPYILKMTCYVKVNNSNSSKWIYALVDNLTDRVVWQTNSYPNQSLYVRNYDDLNVIRVLEPLYESKQQVDVYFSLYNYITNDHAWYVHFLGIGD